MNTRQETCPKCESPEREKRMLLVFQEPYYQELCDHTWRTLPTQGAVPTQQQCSPEHPCDFCESTREPAVPPVPRCVMCETGKTGNGQPVFQKPELVDIRGEKLWRHKWVADQMFCTTCAVPPVSAEPKEVMPNAARDIRECKESDVTGDHPSGERDGGVPAKPRSAEQLWADLWDAQERTKAMEEDFRLHESENATLREQLAGWKDAALELGLAPDALNVWRNERAEKAEAALLSAQKETAHCSKQNLEWAKSCEHWKEQAERWQEEFGKMVEIRNGFVAELDTVQKENLTLREALVEARKIVRGKHSTLSSGPQSVLDQIDAALSQGKKS